MSFDSGDNVYDNYSQRKWLPVNDIDVRILWPAWQFECFMLQVSIHVSIVAMLSQPVLWPRPELSPDAWIYIQLI